ncbi:hypothetical protein CR513_03453, partial [Mucuna pruriens]
MINYKKNLIINATSSPFVSCFYYNGKCHIAFLYRNIRRYGIPSGKYTWIPKESKLLTNLKGSIEKFVCLQPKISLWYLDSGCLNMTGDKTNFSNLSPLEEYYVNYGNNNQ